MDARFLFFFFILHFLLILNWIYRSGIGSQNHIGFKCTTQQKTICVLHHGPIAPGKVSFRGPHFPPCPPPPTAPPPFPLAITTVVSSVCHTYIVLILSRSFLQPPTPLPSGSWQSVLCNYVSVSISRQIF